MTSELLLETWVKHARHGLFGADFTREGCRETCNDMVKCIVCRTEMHLDELAPPQGAPA